MLPPQDKRAEITTTCNQENAQYAEVQKKQKTENVYVIFCFSLILHREADQEVACLFLVRIINMLYYTMTAKADPGLEDKNISSF